MKYNDPEVNVVKITSDFIAIYKLGDNINYNLKSLRVLVAAAKNAEPEDKDAFIKPITILIASITEAVLYDFIYRIRHFTREPSHIPHIILGIACPAGRRRNDVKWHRSKIRHAR